MLICNSILYIYIYIYIYIHVYSNYKIKSFFTIGAIYFHDCTVQNKIPIFLIVVGGVELVIFLICLCFFREDKIIVKKALAIIRIIFHIGGILPATAYIIIAWLDWHPQQLSCSNNSYNPKCCNLVLMYFAICCLAFWYIYPIISCLFFCAIRYIFTN